MGLNLMGRRSMTGALVALLAFACLGGPASAETRASRSGW